MTINNELFVRPPLSFEIPNDGVTNVDRPEDSNQWDVLKYELESFVCEGEYEHGLHASSTLTPVTGTERRSLLSGFRASTAAVNRT